MIDTIFIRDYQSLGKADINFAPITLIVGQNYAGKSAVLRALRALATNQSGDEFIRQGAKEAAVSVWIDGVEIGWSKAKGKGGEYCIDDRLFTKTGGQVPEEVADSLGIRPIHVDDTFSLLPQLQAQWDTPFLIGESGSRVARILGKLTKLDAIVSAQMSCRKQRDRHGKAAEAAEEERERLERQHAALPPVAELRDTLTLISQALTRAHTLERENKNVASLLEERVLLERARSLNLSALRQRVEEAGLILAGLLDTVPLVTERASTQKRVGAADEGITRVTESLAAAQERYHAECKRIGVCSTCPLVEAV